MFIGGTDERALHHLVAELLDNAMDEAVAGHADWIELRLDAEGGVTVKDNGRGIPTDPHPKFPDKSALEVILTTLHAGGKFSTPMSMKHRAVCMASASRWSMRCPRNWRLKSPAKQETLCARHYARGVAGNAENSNGAAPCSNRRGTQNQVPARSGNLRRDPSRFKPAIGCIADGAGAKAYLVGGVEIRWACDPTLLSLDKGR